MRVLLGLLVLVVLAAIILFATGFWSLNVKEGSLPDVNVSASGGSLPAVELESKKLVVGTEERNISVPTIAKEEKTLEVPVVEIGKGNQE